MDNIEKAFSKYPRVNFVLEDMQNAAEIDSALPIGFGQTISQPSTVKLMLEWLEIEPENKVLDVGSGSGWTTALASYLVGPRGKIYAIDRISELVELGKHNCQKVGVKNANFYPAGNVYGLPRFAPYDRILVSASAQKLPDELVDQIKPGGKLVIPVKYDILEITKHSSKHVDVSRHPGFIFVPLV